MVVIKILHLSIDFFEGTFNHRHSHCDMSSISDSGARESSGCSLSSILDEQCQVSIALSSPLGSDVRNNYVDGAFEVSFQRVAGATSFLVMPMGAFLMKILEVSKVLTWFCLMCPFSSLMNCAL